MRKRVDPAERVAGRKPVALIGVAVAKHGKRAEGAIGAGNPELVEVLHGELQRALGAVDLDAARHEMAARHPRSLEDADRAMLELEHRGKEIVRLDGAAPRVLVDDDAGESAGTDRIGAEQEAGEIDVVRPEIAEGTGAGGRLLVPPAAEARAARLRTEEKIGTVVEDLAELALGDHAASQLQGRKEAVVEGAHVPHAGRLDRLPHAVRILGGGRAAASRNRRACRPWRPRSPARHGDRWDRHCRPARSVGSAMICAPIVDRALPAIAPARLFQALAVAPVDGDEPRKRDALGGDHRHIPIADRVRLSHEGIADHADPDLAGRRNRFARWTTLE